MDTHDLRTDMALPVQMPSSSLDDRPPAKPANRQPRKSRFDEEPAEAELPSEGAGEHQIDRLA